jgi:hypothetical protein
MRIIGLVLVVLLMGCVQKYYGAPASQLSAEKQLVFVEAVECAIQKLNIESVKAGKVFLYFNPSKTTDEYLIAQATQSGLTVQDTVPAGFLLPVSGGGFVTVRSQLPQEENYIAERMRERLVRAGIKIVQTEEEADFIIYTLLFSSGTETTMRELTYQNIPFFYSEEVEHLLHLLILAYQKSEKRFVRLIDGKAVAKDMEIFLLKTYGPKLKTVREDKE